MIETPIKSKQKLEKKLITDLPLEDVSKDIETKLKDLNIDKNRFANSFDEILKKLYRFLSEYEIRYEDFASPDRLLRGLCLVDMWIDTARYKHKGRLQKLKSTIDRFKLICISTDTNNWKYVQLSEKVLRQSNSGNKRDILFNPDIEGVGDNYRLAVDQALEKIKNDHIDKERSDFIIKHIFDIFPQLEDLLLSNAVYQNTGKLPFEIKILNLSTQELVNFPVAPNHKLCWTAFLSVDYKTGKTQIFLSYDNASFEKTAEHEILHAISSNTGSGIMEGYGGMIRRGMNEAMTENKNSKKLSYPYPRYILEKVLDGRPQLEKLAYEAYFGCASRDELTAALFNLYGSEGVIKFDFMISNNFEKNDSLGKSVLFDFEECLEFFSKGIDDSFLKATQETKNLEIKFEKIDNIFYDEEHRKRTYDQKKDWRKSFADPAIDISINLGRIVKYLKDIPLKDILVEKWELKYYNQLLQKLLNFDFKEDEETKKLLIDLEETTKKWEIFIERKKNDYCSKHNQKPIFERQPNFRSNSKLTSKALENAWLASQLMQNRSIH